MPYKTINLQKISFFVLPFSKFTGILFILQKKWRVITLKKNSKLLLLSVTVLCLLTGCYKQDTKISINQFGSVNVDISMLGNDEAISQVSGGSTYEELMSNIMPQIEELKTNDSMTAEEISEEVGGETYNGIRITAKYPSVAEMDSSVYFQAFNGSIAVPVTSSDTSETGFGITFKDMPNVFGTVYTANGTISLSQGGELSDEDAAKLANSTIDMKFSFPFCSYGSGGKIVNPTYKFNITADNPTSEVHFWVFIPNFAFLITLILLIVLIVVVIVLLNKIKKLTPTDDDPNAEPLDDVLEDALSEDDVNFFEGNFENIDETVEETAEETDNDINEDTEE